MDSPEYKVLREYYSMLESGIHLLSIEEAEELLSGIPIPNEIHSHDVCKARLLENGEDIAASVPKDGPLHAACEYIDSPSVVCPLTHLDVNFNDLQQSPFLLAKSKEVNKLLIQHGAHDEDVYTKHHGILDNVFSKYSLKKQVKMSVIGHGGVGKSTLIDAISTVCSTVDNTFTCPKIVDDVDQTTTGIVQQLFRHCVCGKLYAITAIQIDWHYSNPYGMKLLIHCQLASSTGVVPQSKLVDVFPAIHTTTSVRFLSHLELAVLFEDQELINKHIGSSIEKYLLCAALIGIKITPRAFVYQFGQLCHSDWILSTTRADHFLDSTFLHALLKLTLSLDLASKEAIEIPALQYQCSVKKAGIYWNTPQAWEVLLEVADEYFSALYSSSVNSQLMEIINSKKAISNIKNEEACAQAALVTWRECNKTSCTLRQILESLCVLAGKNSLEVADFCKDFLSAQEKSVNEPTNSACNWEFWPTCYQQASTVDDIIDGTFDSIVSGNYKTFDYKCDFLKSLQLQNIKYLLTGKHIPVPAYSTAMGEFTTGHCQASVLNDVASIHYNNLDLCVDDVLLASNQQDSDIDMVQLVGLTLTSIGAYKQQLLSEILEDKKSDRGLDVFPFGFVVVHVQIVFEIRPAKICILNSILLIEGSPASKACFKQKCTAAGSKPVIGTNILVVIDAGLLLMMFLLLLQCGDIETNPGPNNGGSDANKSDSKFKQHLRDRRSKKERIFLPNSDTKRSKTDTPTAYDLSKPTDYKHVQAENDQNYYETVTPTTGDGLTSVVSDLREFPERVGFQKTDVEVFTERTVSHVEAIHTMFDAARRMIASGKVYQKQYFERIGLLEKKAFVAVEAIFKLLTLEVSALMEFSKLEDVVSHIEERSYAVFRRILHQAITAVDSDDEMVGQDTLSQIAALVENDPEMLDSSWSSLDTSTRAKLQRLCDELDGHGLEYRNLVSSVKTFKGTKSAQLLNVVGRTVILKLGMEFQKLIILEEAVQEIIVSIEDGDLILCLKSTFEKLSKELPVSLEIQFINNECVELTSEDSSYTPVDVSTLARLKDWSKYKKLSGKYICEESTINPSLMHVDVLFEPKAEGSSKRDVSSLKQIQTTSIIDSFKKNSGTEVVNPEQMQQSLDGQELKTSPIVERKEDHSQANFNGDFAVKLEQAPQQCEQQKEDVPPQGSDFTQSCIKTFCLETAVESSSSDENCKQTITHKTDVVCIEKEVVSKFLHKESDELESKKSSFDKVCPVGRNDASKQASAYSETCPLHSLSAKEESANQLPPYSVDEVNSCQSADVQVKEETMVSQQQSADGDVTELKSQNVDVVITSPEKLPSSLLSYEVTYLPHLVPLKRTSTPSQSQSSNDFLVLPDDANGTLQQQIPFIENDEQKKVFMSSTDTRNNEMVLELNTLTELVEHWTKSKSPKKLTDKCISDQSTTSLSLVHLDGLEKPFVSTAKGSPKEAKSLDKAQASITVSTLSREEPDQLCTKARNSLKPSLGAATCTIKKSLGTKVVNPGQMLQELSHNNGELESYKNSDGKCCVVKAQKQSSSCIKMFSADSATESCSHDYALSELAIIPGSDVVCIKTTDEETWTTLSQQEGEGQESCFDTCPAGTKKSKQASTNMETNSSNVLVSDRLQASCANEQTLCQPNLSSFDEKASLSHLESIDRETVSSNQPEVFETNLHNGCEIECVCSPHSMPIKNVTDSQLPLILPVTARLVNLCSDNTIGSSQLPESCLPLSDVAARVNSVSQPLVSDDLSDSPLQPDETRVSHEQPLSEAASVYLQPPSADNSLPSSDRVSCPLEPDILDEPNCSPSSKGVCDVLQVQSSQGVTCLSCTPSLDKENSPPHHKRVLTCPSNSTSTKKERSLVEQVIEILAEFSQLSPPTIDEDLCVFPINRPRSLDQGILIMIRSNLWLYNRFAMSLCRLRLLTFYIPHSPLSVVLKRLVGSTSHQQAFESVMKLLNGSPCLKFWLDSFKFLPQSIVKEHIFVFFQSSDNKLLLPWSEFVNNETKIITTLESKAKVCKLFSSNLSYEIGGLVLEFKECYLWLLSSLLVCIISRCILCPCKQFYTDSLQVNTDVDASTVFLEPESANSSTHLSHPCIISSDLPDEESDGVNCSTKARIKRSRQLPPSKQVYTLSQPQKRKTDSCADKQSLFDKDKTNLQNVSQKCTGPKYPSNRARYRATLKRQHQNSQSAQSDSCIKINAESNSSDCYSAFSSVENDLVNSRERESSQVYNIGPMWTGVTHSICLPTDCHENNLADGLTFVELAQLQTLSTTFPFIQQTTEPRRFQFVEQSVVSSGSKCTNNHSVTHKLVVVPRVSVGRGKKGNRMNYLLCVAETSSDYSLSKMVNACCFMDQLVHISKVLRAHRSELTRLLSHSQSSDTSPTHSEGSQQSQESCISQHQASSGPYHTLADSTTDQRAKTAIKRTNENNYSDRRPTEAFNTAHLTGGPGSTKQSATPVKADGDERISEDKYGSNKRRGHASNIDPNVLTKGPGNNRQSANKVQGDSESQVHYERNYNQTSSLPRTYQQAGNNVETAREIGFEVQHSMSRRPDWISAVTELLHVPDYPKMIQRLNTETPTTEHFVSHRFIRGIAYFKIGKFQLAMRDLSEGERYAQETDQRGGVSLCNVYLGDLYYSSGSHSKAAKCYQKAAEYYESDNIAKLFRMVAPTVSAIRAKCGSCFRTLSKSVEAIQEYKKAIEASTKDKDRLTAHTSLGNLYQSSGQNNEALKEYEQALGLAEKLNDHVSVAWTHGNLGNAYLGLGMKDKALFHLQKALDLTVKYEPTPSAIGRAYNNIGTAYQSMGDLDKAEEHYDLALSQAIYGNDPAGQARVYGNIGNIFIVRKMFEKAIPHYSEVLRLSTDEATVTTALHNRGCAYYEWAESKMIALEKSSSSTKDLPASLIVVRIHGSKAVSHEHSPRIVIDSVYKLYKQGKDDLEKVLASHERKLDHIKGSAKGLSLTVSLFESNSRTFHRLQDCMVNLGNWREALLVAEQSKARTLGEMMLARKGSQLDHPLTSPLNLKQVFTIVSSQSSPVLYLSHTGASILGWVLIPLEDSSSIFMEMFEVPLTDDQFDGKSFDYHTRYSLTEILVEQSYEMYCSVEYSDEYTAPAVTLYELIGRPLQAILKKAKKLSTPQKIVLVTDTYTALLPFTCLYDPDSKTFLGDSFYFEIELSFLTMGIMNQLPEPIVELPADPQNMCIIGNPTIPQFYHNNEVWSLGKLPYAKREAQWVGHILGTPPILDEQATKSAILMRFMRAKVIHIATHGSSVSGFLAFSALTSTRQGEVVDSSSVLLHPEEVEKLSISPALVVLSSCDSARGTVKADGIQGMARAFLLAGAQAVLTALWRVPDESAAVFMRFFYRFLGEGLESSLALQKSILSLRCFAKYSQYIHWSGYQLTGRSICFAVSSSSVTTILDSTLGQSSVFPRLMLVKKLQSVLVENPRLPTDIQILHGSPGVKPSEIAIDFIHSSHETFSAGIFWINCLAPDLINASFLYIEKTINKPLNRMRLNETQQALFVLDNATELPNSQQLIQLFKHANVHIIILSKHSEALDPLVKEIDKVLIRGCKIHEVKTLSTIDSTQRTVYEVFKKHQLSANNNDQRILEKLAEFTSGSPVIVDIAIHVLLKFIRESENPSDGLNEFSKSIELIQSGKSAPKLQTTSSKSPFQVRAISDELTRLAPELASVSPTHRDAWESESEYDSWDSIAALLDHCINSPGELLLLRSLAIFGCSPIPLPLVMTMSSFIAQSSGHSHLAGILHERLLEAKVLKKYPLPVVLHSSYTQDNTPTEPQFVYVPQHLANHLWTTELVDQLISITLAFRALKTFKNFVIKQKSATKHFFLGLISLLEEKTVTVKEKQCFEKVYGLYLSTYHELHTSL